MTAAATHTSTPVAVLGLGAMGQAIAGAFLAAGHPTTVWNRSPGKGEQLVERGAVRAGSVGEAVRASEVVVVCLLDQTASRAVLDPYAADLRGRVLVDLTSDTPQRAREAAAWAEKEGLDYLDGAMMVNVPMVGTPEALVFLGGSADAYERSRPTLAALGGQVTHLGADHGLAAAYDLAVLDFFWTSMSGLVHAFALAQAEGIKAADLVPYLNGNGGLLASIAPAMAADADGGRYPGDADNLVMDTAGVTHVLHAAEHHGLDASALRAVKSVADRAIARGHGADGWTATIEAVRSPA
ncbi:NAD(P)-dependent oxidoreductase [Streptomyces boluensis]|uniref:NAD(P)-binding domain-containing protein n=1 Tax=Streptomyces boluensis TaxID=1775135 RepID=A0A964UMH3_9ACTN|nr:NAD(P)-binding domain-containing protein [Streptomyces boluensis]NBE51357.1 NAD(P)-binding domain-containing protein [Streptomyces boluensis]